MAGTQHDATPNDLRGLDQTDLILLSLLERDGRMTNKDLAVRAHIAPSTCLLRVRRLHQLGAITGVHANVDPAWLGHPIQAMIAVRLSSNARFKTETFARELATVPGVLNVYFVSGTHDFMVHVAATGSDGLRSFIVKELSSKDAVAGTETHLIFEHARGTQPLARPRPYAPQA